MQTVLFYLFAVLSIISAFLAITRKNPVLSAVWLVVCLFALSAVYVLLEAFFLAAVQVIVYAGAVLMLFIFVIMMLNLRSGIIGPMRNIGIKLLGLALCVFVLGRLWKAFSQASALAGAAPQTTEGFGEPASLGALLLSAYVYPFELIGILLLVAVTGALVLARKEEP
ncbi:NADH-quinone oxidoreductase subunit J [bacterium]|nr:NADH-quinone oxidoreductase subunit J [bacterium]